MLASNTRSSILASRSSCRFTCLAMLAASCGFVIAGNVASAAELQWRHAKTPTHQKTEPARQTLRMRSPTIRRDAAVRPAAFEEEHLRGPSFAGYENDGENMRSVVVEPEPSGKRVRSAQLQFRPPGADADSRYEENIRTPFGEEPAATEPPSDYTEDLFGEMDEEVDLPPLPDEEPAMDDGEELVMPDESERQPMDGLRQPAATPPRTFQPQPPELPRGRAGADTIDRAPLPRDYGGRDTDVDAKKLADEESKTRELCSQELADLKGSTLADVDLNIYISGSEGTDFPFECSIDDGSWHSGRCWPQTVYMWKAAALCHKPLYFEDEALERYGHSWGPCCDPLVSGAHFFSRLPILPYCMGISPPCECQYALGHYRPGSCAPYMCDPVPIMSRAALIQAGSVVGAAVLIP